MTRQEVSRRDFLKVTGTLGAVAWRRAAGWSMARTDQRLRLLEGKRPFSRSVFGMCHRRLMFLMYVRNGRVFRSGRQSRSSDQSWFSVVVVYPPPNTNTTTDVSLPMKRVGDAAKENGNALVSMFYKLLAEIL